MEMVSAVKMRKAQQRVTASRPYSDQLRQIMSDLATQQPDPEQLAAVPPPPEATRAYGRADRRHPGPRSDRRVEHEYPAPRQPVHSGRGRGASTDYRGREKSAGLLRANAAGGRRGVHRYRGKHQSRRGAADRGHCHRRFRHGQGRRGLRRLLPLRQHPGAAAGGDADSSGRAATEPTRGTPTTSSNRPRRPCSTTFCRATSRCSSTRPSWRGLPPSTRRAWSPCAAPPTTPRTSFEIYVLDRNKARQAQITREVSEIAAGANAMAG